MPGLSWPHAVGSDLAARAVVSTVPGPTDVATRFVLYRQWSIPTDVASAGIVFAALFETFSYLVLPLIATVGVLVTGHPTRSRALLLALVGLVVLVAGTSCWSRSCARRASRGDWAAGSTGWPSASGSCSGRRRRRASSRACWTCVSARRPC